MKKTLHLLETVFSTKKTPAFNYPATLWVVYTFLNKASNFIFSWLNIKSAGTANLTFLSLQIFSDCVFQGAMLLVGNQALSAHPVHNI